MKRKYKYLELKKPVIVSTMVIALLVPTAFVSEATQTEPELVTPEELSELEVDNTLEPTYNPIAVVSQEIDESIDIDESTYEELNIENENMYLDGVILSDFVFVRESPSIEAEKIGQLNKGDEIKILNDYGNWYEIKYEDSTGYVSKEYVGYSYELMLEDNTPKSEDEAEYMVVDVDDYLMVRLSPSEDAEMIGSLSGGSLVTVLDEQDGWTKIVYGSNVGYINSEFLIPYVEVIPLMEEPTNNTSNSGNTNNSSNNSSSSNTQANTSVPSNNDTQYYEPVPYSSNSTEKGDEIVAYAMQFLGTPYVWGGTDLNNGVDCSGFVYQVMKDNGVSVSRTSRDQATNGYAVSKSELMPGDLVFFDTDGSNNGGVSHSGIYIGGGQFIHAASSSKTPYVTINSLDEPYYQSTYVTARRVI